MSGRIGEGHVRRWLAGAFCAVSMLVAAVAVAGCGGGHARPAPRAVLPSASRQPAAVAGGACQLLDYDVVQAQLGVRFDIAASGNVNATYTCVLQPASADLPDLSLAVTATQVDATTFKNTVVPKGGATVDDLGRIAYSDSVPADDGTGPGLEIGWLSANQRLIVLTFTTADGTSDDDVNALLPKMVDLAKLVDLTSA